LRKAYGTNDDYTKAKDEQMLHHGEWHWMNFIEKGDKKTELF
jgi:hypothetical protein